jgi:hypothetical protein
MSDHLDIPAWVQAAWTQPLKKGEILFQSVRAEQGNEDDCRTNASIRAASEYSYSEGYRRAARIVADHVIQNKWNQDFLVYPTVFLYRHYVELQLKRLISTGAFLVDQVLSDGERKLLQTSHRLDQLWALLKPILRKALPMSPEDIAAIDCYVIQLHDIDPLSYSTRYMFTKVGTPSIDKNKVPQINIGVLSQGMEKFTNYLFGLGEAVREAYEIKCEMDAEARAEYMEYYDGE